MPDQTVYLLGPMTGYPDDNRPAFRAATKLLRSRGYRVTSPDELDQRDPAASREWAAMLRRDLPWLAAATMGVALPGWRASKGATLEATNLHALGAPIFELIEGELFPVPESRLPRPTHP